MTQQLCIGCRGQERVDEEAREHVHLEQDRLKLWICGWSGDTWDPATAYFLAGLSVTRFEREVPSTAVVNMFGGSGSTSVSIVSSVRVNLSQPTLRVEALSPGNLSTKLVLLPSISLTFHEEIQIHGTHTVNLYTNSKAGSRTGCAHGQHADRSPTVHPVTSEHIPGRTLVVVLAPDMQQNQTIYVHIDTGAGLDSSGNSLVGLTDMDSNFAVAEKVVDPKGTGSFWIGEISITTTLVISFLVSVPLARENACLIGPGQSQIRLNLRDLHFLSHIPACLQHRHAPFESHGPCCPGQKSKPQRRGPPIGGTAQGSLNSS